MDVDSSQPLVDIEDKITVCLSNLMLTGQATPYIHNGILSTNQEDAAEFKVSELLLGVCDLQFLDISMTPNKLAF
jgi:hypothetical protein